MTTRARYADVILAPTGVPIPGATVDVYDTGTTSHIAGTIHDSAVGGSTLSNPVVANGQGEIEFWLDAPIRVDLKYSRPGYVDETHVVEVLSAAPPASTIAVTPTGAIAATDVQAALAELDTEKSATAHAHSGTYGRGGIAGTVADYTGRYGVAGTGTDNRAAIQTALNAASVVTDSGYYGYLKRRSQTVKLDPGQYWISAPSSGASLVIPPGVTFDCSDATLYFDYPTTTTNYWCGIQIGQYGQLLVGRILQSFKVAAPDTGSVYDGVRLVLTDDNSKLIGYKDSEISGFQGACVRLIGAWISEIKGIRLQSCDYGIIRSAKGSAFTNYLDSGGGAALDRGCTDLWVEDCHLVNLPKGGLLGECLGNTPNINIQGYPVAGGVVGFTNCDLENIGSYAIYETAITTFYMDNCHVEEAGAGDGVIWTDTVRLVTIKGLQYNLAGRTITLANGTQGVVFPSSLFKFSTGTVFSLEGLHFFNSFNSGMKFANTTPLYFSVGGIYTASFAFAAGTIPGDTGNTIIDGLYNGRHFNVRGSHIWVDATGAIRIKSSAPSSDLDGAPLPLDTAVAHLTGNETIAGIKTFSSNPVVPTAAFPESAVASLVADLAAKASTSHATTHLAGGTDELYLLPGLSATRIESIPRVIAPDQLTATAGAVHLGYFTAPRNLTISQLSMFCIGAQTGATDEWLVLYSVDGSGNLTLVARTADDTTIFNTANAYSTKSLDAAFAASYAMVRGQLYAAGSLVVGASTQPKFLGVFLQNGNYTNTGMAPRLVGSVTGQTTPATSYAVGSVGNSNGFPWAAGL